MSFRTIWGLDIPTNYEEFINMLREFKKQGFCLYPYTAPNITDNYNIKQFWREFVWDSDPDICYDKASDKYFDGFDTPSFKAALERIRTAYAKGLIDPDIFVNSTAACRADCPKTNNLILRVKLLHIISALCHLSC